MTNSTVVALPGVTIKEPEHHIDKARAWAQLHEEVATLQDLGSRMAQQLQDELDDSSAKGEFRPDLQGLLEECDRVLSVGGER